MGAQRQHLTFRLPEPTLERLATRAHQIRETRTALALLETGRAGVVQSEAALAVAQRNRDETEILYAQGLTTSLALADASQSLFEAEVARARARNGAGIALLDVWAALGLESSEVTKVAAP